MVFESIVAELLNKYLGSFIESLDSSQLNLGIFSGKIITFEQVSSTLGNSSSRRLHYAISDCDRFQSRLDPSVRVPLHQSLVSPMNLQIDCESYDSRLKRMIIDLFIFWVELTISNEGIRMFLWSTLAVKIISVKYFVPHLNSCLPMPKIQSCLHCIETLMFTSANVCCEYLCEEGSFRNTFFRCPRRSIIVSRRIFRSQHVRALYALKLTIFTTRRETKIVEIFTLWH